MIRTQVYLDPAQKRRLSQIGHRCRVTISQLIRQAVDQFLGKNPSAFEQALEKSFGLWSKGKRKDLGSTSAYVRKLRREWETRVKRTPAQALLELSGSWHHDRPAEEIVRGIRHSRRNSKKARNEIRKRKEI
jgi:hypothetical protein